MSLARRIDRLEQPLAGGQLWGWARAMATEVAIEAGLDPDDVIREAEAILTRAEAAGVLGSADALTAFLGTESGIDPEALLAEAQRLVEHR